MFLDVFFVSNQSASVGSRNVEPGVSLISIGLLSWRTPDVAGEAMASYGQLYSIIGVLWVLLIGYHAATGQASGPPVYGNLAINAVLATLFFMYSKK